MFNIPILGGIPVGESVVVTWIIMAALTILSIVLVRNLKVENPGRKQLVLESFIGFLNDFFTDILGEEGKRYIPYLISTALYIGVANLIGLLGFKPPTKDLNVTAALALMSVFLIYYSGFHKKGGKGFVKSFAEPMALVAPINIMEIAIVTAALALMSVFLIYYSGFHKKGGKGFVKSFAEPMALVAPINIMEIAIRPVSLCMRLFGNVIGSFVIMELLKTVMPALLPIPFSLYFDVFDGLIQTYVFVFLTSLFIKEQIED